MHTHADLGILHIFYQFDGSFKEQLLAVRKGGETN